MVMSRRSVDLTTIFFGKLYEAVTLPPAYLSCEFAFHVRFQRIVRALNLNCV